MPIRSESTESRDQLDLTIRASLGEERFDLGADCAD